MGKATLSFPRPGHAFREGWKLSLITLPLFRSGLVRVSMPCSEGEGLGKKVIAPPRYLLGFDQRIRLQKNAPLQYCLLRKSKKFGKSYAEVFEIFVMFLENFFDFAKMCI